MDKKIQKLFNELSGEQIGRLLGIFFTDVYMREIGFDILVGSWETESEKRGIMKKVKALIKIIKAK